MIPIRIIHIAYLKQTPIIDTVPIPTGQIGTIKLNFSYSDEWNEYPQKIAILKRRDRSVRVDIIDDECSIPPELLIEAGDLLVGVCGLDDDGIIQYAGEFARIEVSHGASVIGSCRSVKEIWERIEAILSEIEDVTVSAEELPPETDPTVEITGGGEEPYNIHFGIPEGRRGIQGEPGIDAGISGATVEIQGGYGDPGVSIDVGGTPIDRTFHFVFENLRGSGISNISKVSSSGLVDTYRVDFEDGSNYFYYVTNGEKGDKGDTGEITGATASISGGYGVPSVGVVPGGTSTERTFEFVFQNLRGSGVSSVTKVGTSGLVDTYKMLFDDGRYVNYYVTNGAKGDKGDTGNIMYATFDIDPATGNLIMTTPDGYSGTDFYINDNGEIVVRVN